MEQVPDLLRALGVYPSDWDIQDILHEIQAMGDESGAKTAIDFDEFTRLYVNHRPVLGVSHDKILDAFKTLGCEPTSGMLDRKTLVNALLTRGEHFDEEELAKAFGQLIGAPSIIDNEDKQPISAKEFAEEVLGFES